MYLAETHAKAGTLLGWFGTTTSIFTFGIIPLVTWISTKIRKKEDFLNNNIYLSGWICIEMGRL